ncbi:MAG: hypothetical protein JXD22_12955 [Sedimentisphaerales bacterium]|nr:hypothetical protein [Sedimentisphaerales bacterium]
MIISEKSPKSKANCTLIRPDFWVSFHSGLSAVLRVVIRASSLIRHLAAAKRFGEAGSGFVIHH